MTNYTPLSDDEIDSICTGVSLEKWDEVHWRYRCDAARNSSPGDTVGAVSGGLRR